MKDVQQQLEAPLMHLETFLDECWNFRCRLDDQRRQTDASRRRSSGEMLITSDGVFLYLTGSFMNLELIKLT